MKRLVFKLLLCVSVFFMTISASAQSKEDMLRRRAAQKVGQMCDYIEFMSDFAQKEEKSFASFRHGCCSLGGL